MFPIHWAPSTFSSDIARPVSRVALVMNNAIKVVVAVGGVMEVGSKHGSAAIS
jgi:hypothetical protein